MKVLRNISIAVLACLVVAAPASASTVTVKIAPESSIFTNTAVTYTVSGEAYVQQTFEVRFMYVEPTHPASECTRANPNSKQLHAPIEVAEAHGKPIEPFSYSETVPTHSALGTYVVCAIIKEHEGSSIQASAERDPTTETDFSVVPEPSPTLVQPPIPTPSVQPAVVPVAQHATTTSAKKVALAKCRKQKNKKKRQKCERTANKRYRH